MQNFLKILSSYQTHISLGMRNSQRERFGFLALLILLGFGLIPVPILADTTKFDAAKIVTGKLPVFVHQHWHFPHHNQPISGVIWYPSQSKTPPIHVMKVGDNKVFYGRPIQTGANLADGKFPLIVLSHGLGGNQYNISWLATALVTHGYIVAGVNHPGTTSGDFAPHHAIRHWTRAQDISHLLDALLADPVYGKGIDQQNIAVLGFSLGGLTSLQLVGARTDLSKYRQFCADDKNKIDCQIWEKSAIDLGEISADKFGQSLIDKRVKRVITIDPPLTVAMNVADLQKRRDDVLLINLGDTANRLPTTDLWQDGQGFARHFPAQNYHQILQGNHFSFLGLCKPEGARFLREDGEDPVCDAPDKSDREKIHRKILSLVIDFLQK